MISSIQGNLREALSSHSAEYRKAYLAALAAALFTEDYSTCQSTPQEEPVLPDCVGLLLGDLEDQRCGSEFLSQALFAASLLLSQWPDSRFGFSSASSDPLLSEITFISDTILISASVSQIAPALERWCCILESHRTPENPEVLRMACAEAVCVAGVPLSLREDCRAFMSRWDPVTSVKQKMMWVNISKQRLSCRRRLIGTGLCLLQDQSQQVRTKAAHFTSALHHARRGESHRSSYIMQVNKALQVLMDLLLEDCWEDPGTLEVLLGYLPQLDLRSVAQGASDTG